VAGLSQGDAMRSPAAQRRLREARRKRHLRRRMAVLVLLLAGLIGLYFAAGWAFDRWLGSRAAAGSVPKTQAPAAALLGNLSFKPERFLPLSDVTGDGQPERVAVGPVEGGARKVGLVTGSDRSPMLVGQPVTVPDFPLSVQDLPRARGVLVLAATLPSSGPPKPVTVAGEKALLAAGGEPDLRAWQPDPTVGLKPVNYYQLAAPAQPSEPDVIVIDKWLNVLWAYQKGQLVQTARVSTGRHVQGPNPSAGNQALNMVTPTGRFTVTNKLPGVTYYAENIPRGDPRNPLGTRWLGFSVYPGDRASVWAIHGTNEPDMIGRWVSDGCIRMLNAEVEALYDRVNEGIPVIIMSSQP
jgi:lipoprotein-anchoring transpeptidase ErfK/SrfK